MSRKNLPFGYLQGAKKSARFVTSTIAENLGENCLGNLRHLVDYFASNHS